MEGSGHSPRSSPRLCSPRCSVEPKGREDITIKEVEELLLAAWLPLPSGFKSRVWQKVKMNLR